VGRMTQATEMTQLAKQNDALLKVGLA
jgi:hypothetical protein